MDANQVLAEQMAALGRLGPPFADALQRAPGLGVSDEFLREGSALLRQLSGNPGAGAPDCIRDAPKDLASTEAFLAKWAPSCGTPGYDDVLKHARATAEALRVFNDTIRNLSKGERRGVEASAEMGHAFRGMLGRRSQYEEKYRPFVVTTLVGTVLWTATGGFIHAYVICPDWEQLGPTAIEKLAGLRPLLALLFTGLFFGLSIEVAKFLGAVLRSEGAVMLAPIVAGAAIGALQGTVVPTELWGFAESVVYRSESTRILSGAMCGFILTVPSIMIGIGIRRRGRPW